MAEKMGVEDLGEVVRIPCLVCGLAFSNTSNLNLHKSSRKHKAIAKRKGMEEEDIDHGFPCQVCDITFNLASNLTKHKPTATHHALAKEMGVVEEIVEGEDRHCDACNKTILGPSTNFSRHEGTAKHKAVVASKKLEDEAEEEQGVGAEDRLRCRVCNRKFVNIGNLNRHKASQAHKVLAEQKGMEDDVVQTVTEEYSRPVCPGR